MSGFYAWFCSPEKKRLRSIKKKENRTNKTGSLDQKHQKRTKDGFIGKICSQCLSPDIWKLCLP
jgi:hypothetical protein